ncbi:Tyrosinase family protein [Lachnellula hyalina]|uniref:Tyrosinase family protein n=1 Tax=Lachnellula hyalina TaxID=1316788 RepID=A0A8H8R200_9HELO|nr:Tyrosinase family protein [Lachnellula hyalina]TVY26939.1 Tyrosinase family protein [Lachnellula hyalina]
MASQKWPRSSAFLLSMLLLVLPASSLIPTAIFPRGAPQIKTIPSQAVTGDIIANFQSANDNLDGPQLSAVNSTSFDWWYFDVVSPDLLTSLTVVFFTTLNSSFPFVPPSSNVDVIGVFYSFPNGTCDSIFIYALEANITIDDNGSSGQYVGTGTSWSGSPDLSRYEINVNSPEHGISGTFTLETLAPAHYPCGPATAGQDMTVAPHIGWSNAMPDAVGTVNLSILGTEMEFEGVAYHDKNWSDQPFQQNVASWYWGHGRLGAYSIVWFDTLGLDGTEYVSAYASKDGEIVFSSCEASSLTVRPSGGDDQYPPSVSGGDPTGFTIWMDLGDAGALDVNVTMGTVILDGGPSYKRWTASMQGQVRCGQLMTGGMAVLEQFKMA